MAEKLTPKQLRFVELYEGNATEAARLAGFKQPQSQGPRLLNNVAICNAIEKRTNKALGKRIATREERQEFWTQTMLDDSAKMPDRLKASELLGKSQADFTDKVEHSGEAGGPIIFQWQGDKDG